MTPRRRVTVTIDRLVLRGIAPDQREAVAASLRQEIQRRIAGAVAAGTLDGPRSQHALLAATLRVRHDAGPADIGRRAGASLVSELAR